MKIEATIATDYLAQVPDERRPHLDELRRLIKKAVPQATEGIVWGMLGYAIDGRPFAAMASHKRHLSLYLMDLYTTPSLMETHRAALARLKMGKSCINFQSVDELPLDTISAILAAAPNVKVERGTMAKVPTAKKANAAKPKAAKASDGQRARRTGTARPTGKAKA